MKNQDILAVVFLLFLSTLARFLPHPPNFSPMTAMVFLSGVFLARPALAIVLPLVFVFISDAFLGFYPDQWVVYLAYLAVGMIGLAQQGRPWKSFGFIGSVVSSSLVFFVISNIGVWWFGGLYAHSVEGLVQCFTLAIPFFANSFSSHLLFVVALGAAYKYALKPLAVSCLAKANS